MKHTVKKEKQSFFKVTLESLSCQYLDIGTLFITDCMSLRYLCVMVITGCFHLFGRMELGQFTLSGLML